MKKVLIAYFSQTGKTRQMAEYIAEGVRFTGGQADVRPISEIKSEDDVRGYDGYIVGSPTFSSDIPEAMKVFLAAECKILVTGKQAGAFGAYHHEVGYEPGGTAATRILDILKDDCGMKPFELSALRLKDDVIETREGMRACQDYGRIFGEKVSVKD